MKFEQIDVREGLLRNSLNRAARRSAEVEIDMSSARSEKALEHLIRGKEAANRYMVDQARLHFTNASTQARKDSDGFIEAAATMSQTILMDGMVNNQSQPHFLEQARQSLEFEIFSLQERFIEERASRDVAAPVLEPRKELLALIEANAAQYALRQESLLIADTLCSVNRYLAAGNWQAAANSARIGAGNAREGFGHNHWWHAVMLSRLATALLRLGRHEEARPMVSLAENILSEWSVEDKDALKMDHDILQAARSDIEIMSAN